MKGLCIWPPVRVPSVHSLCSLKSALVQIEKQFNLLGFIYLFILSIGFLLAAGIKPAADITKSMWTSWGTATDREIGYPPNHSVCM